MTPKTIAVVAADLAPGSPAQHLLDRLLAGYPREGAFAPRAAATIRLHCPGAPVDLVAARRRDLALEVPASLAETLSGADAVLVCQPGRGLPAPKDRLASVLQQVQPGAACFVHGLLAGTREEAAQMIGLAADRHVRLTAGTATAVTFRLPEIRPHPGTRLSEALVVVQGETPEALLLGVEGLLPDLLAGGVDLQRAATVNTWDGEKVWPAGAAGEWSQALLAAAISRSNNPQGDPIRDGRTQDLVGLGLVPRLASRPRAWVTRHAGGCRSAILALDGVVTDLNLAVQTARGAVFSSQLYRPPAPNQQAYGELAGVIDRFFRGAAGSAWTPERAAAAAAWHGDLVGAGKR